MFKINSKILKEVSYYKKLLNTLHAEGFDKMQMEFLLTILTNYQKVLTHKMIPGRTRWIKELGFLTSFKGVPPYI